MESSGKPSKKGIAGLEARMGVTAFRHNIAPCVVERIGYASYGGEMAEEKKIDVVEFDDYTDAGAALGFRCTIAIARALVAIAEPQVLLARLRDLLVSIESDVALDAFRSLALHGVRVQPTIPTDWRKSMSAFAARCRAGLGGVSESGTILAVPVSAPTGSVLMIGQLGFGIVQPDRRPDIVLTTVESANFYIEPIAIRSLR